MGSQMDQSEIWAREYLLTLGFAPYAIVHEPEPNSTPDFLLQDTIAVAVRRLNQYWATGEGQLEALENLDKPLIKRLDKLLSSIGPTSTGVSWAVFPSFRRPHLEKRWEHKLKGQLDRIRLDPPPGECIELEVDEHFSLQLMRRSKPDNHAFILGGSNDEDAGGWVLEELTRSLELCICEKTKKIASRRHLHPEWWLILVDHMMVGRQPEAGPPRIPHDWHRVVVIHPLNYSLAYEIMSV